MNQTATFLLNPIAIGSAAALGCGLCAVGGWSPHLRELGLAAFVILLASEAALVPSMLMRHSTQDVVAQAGFVGTIIHLLFSAALSGAIVFLTHPPQAFLYWVLPFYWATLFVIVAVLVRAVRTASAPAPR